MTGPLVLLLVLLVSAAAYTAAPGGRAEYVGGTNDRLKAGTGGQLDTALADSLVFTLGKEHLAIPYSRINLIEYGQNVNRRLGLAIVVSPIFLLSKARKHFLTVGYLDVEGRQQAVVFRLDKSAVRPLLASLEARTGLKVQFQDEEARKAGRG